MKFSIQNVTLTLFSAATLAACGGGGGSSLPVAFGDTGTAASSVIGQEAVDGEMVQSKPIESCTVELYGDSIMAGNGTAETPAMTLQRIRPGFNVVADHAVAGTMLSMLYPSFDAAARSARFVVIENGV